MGEFLKTIGEGYKIMGQRAQNSFIENRANILTGVSVVGTVGTAVASWFGGMKSARKIDAKAIELGRPLTTKEKASLCWKETILPAGAVVISAGSGITSNRIQAGDIARLTTDAVMATKALNEFKRASKEVLTEKQQQEVKQEVCKKDLEKLEQEPPAKLNIPYSEECWQIFRDKFSGLTFPSTMERVRSQIQRMVIEMKQLPPRDRDGGTPIKHGVPYSHWVNWVKQQCNDPGDGDLGIALYTDYGWNKGYWSLGNDDDDIISAWFDPGQTTWRGETRSCFLIMWDVNPSDMNLGKFLKSADLDID